MLLYGYSLLQHENERLESRLDILRGAINRFYHIINTDKEHEWRKLRTQAFSRSSTIHVHKRSGGASDIYRIQLDISSRTERPWSTTSWHALFQSVGTRKLCKLSNIFRYLYLYISVHRVR